jgi:hypothetical protein
MARALYKITRGDTPEQIKSKTYFAGEIQIDGTLFSYEIFLLPIIRKKEKDRNSMEEYLIKKLGTRLKDGKACLDITEDVVRSNIDAGNYSAFGFIKNLTDDTEWLDEASGTMQYYDWCKKRKGPQLWINDLCRITEPVSAPVGAKKPSTSPLKALMTVFEQVAVKLLGASLTHLYLLVKDQEPERSVLPGIYNKYGFSIVDIKSCHFEDYIVMRKVITERELGYSQLVSSAQDISSLTQQVSSSRTSARSSTPLETVHPDFLNDYHVVEGFHSIFETPELLSDESLRQTTTTESVVGEGVRSSKIKIHKKIKKTKKIKNQRKTKKTRKTDKHHRSKKYKK